MVCGLNAADEKIAHLRQPVTLGFFGHLDQDRPPHVLQTNLRHQEISDCKQRHDGC